MIGFAVTMMTLAALLSTGVYGYLGRLWWDRRRTDRRFAYFERQFTKPYVGRHRAP